MPEIIAPPIEPIYSPSKPVKRILPIRLLLWTLKAAWIAANYAIAFIGFMFILYSLVLGAMELLGWLATYLIG